MRLVSVLILVLGASIGYAQSNTAAPSISTTVTTPSSIFSNPSLMAGWKSWNDAGRPQQLNTPGEKVFKSKNEFFLGGKTQAGYGLYATAVETMHQHTTAPAGAKNPKLSNTNPGDPSLSFVHPIYSDDRLSVTGQAREYFPVTDRSQSQGIYQQAYYLNATYKAPGGYDIWNQLVPRYFSAMKYKPTDSVFYTEDWTTVSRSLRPWVRLGFGQHYQIETHNDTPVGQTWEIFPYADFMISKTIYGGPRVFVPIAVQNTVFDAPTAVSANNIQAELYLQATL